MSDTAMFLPPLLLHKTPTKPERKCSFMHNEHPGLVWVSEVCITEILCYRIGPHYSLSTLILYINKKPAIAYFVHYLDRSIKKIPTMLEALWLKIEIALDAAPAKAKRLCRDFRVFGEIKPMLMFSIPFSGTAFSWHGAALFCTMRPFWNVMIGSSACFGNGLQLCWLWKYIQVFWGVALVNTKHSQWLIWKLDCANQWLTGVRNISKSCLMCPCKLSLRDGKEDSVKELP